MRHLLLIALVLFSCQAMSQSYSTLKAQVEFCREEMAEKEKKVADYKQVMKKQHGEIIEVKKEVHELKQTITELNTENDQLRIENNKFNEPAIRFFDLAQRFEKRKLYQEAIELYNVIIDEYPHSSQAMEARNILRS